MLTTAPTQQPPSTELTEEELAALRVAVEAEAELVVARKKANAQLDQYFANDNNRNVTTGISISTYLSVADPDNSKLRNGVETGELSPADLVNIVRAKKFRLLVYSRPMVFVKENRPLIEEILGEDITEYLLEDEDPVEAILKRVEADNQSGFAMSSPSYQFDRDADLETHPAIQALFRNASRRVGHIIQLPQALAS